MQSVITDVLTVFTEVCNGVGSCVAKELLNHLSQGDYESFLDVRIRISDYQCPETFAFDYMLVSLLSKWKDLPTKVDRRDQAYRSWMAAESQCSLTNKRLRDLELRPDLQKQIQGRVEGVILYARRKIAKILGPCKVSDALSRCRWSGGATFDSRRGSTVSQKQSSNRFAVTAQALPYFKAVLESDPLWFEALTGVYPSGPYSVTRDNFNIVRGNRWLTVPKSAKTDRCIAAEPLANSFLQQGVGRYIRSRLNRFGVNLDDQSINQRLAARAAYEGLATLDLSMASDTLSSYLVRTLLPDDWFDFLNALRSPESKVDGDWIYLSKFSSMGNAYTFELESLIFYALMSACASMEGSDGIISVYGDDIVVGRDLVPLVKEVLAWCGFTVNEEKSHIDGHFFESCGKHYFKGVDVTPIYQKESVDSLPQTIRLANRLVRWSQRVTGSWRDKSIIQAHRLLFDVIGPKYMKLDRISIKPCIPLYSQEDSGFLVPTDWLGSWDMNHGYKCHVLIPRPKLKRGSDIAMYSYKLRRPFHLADHPKGWCYHSKQGGYTISVRYISTVHQSS